MHPKNSMQWQVNISSGNGLVSWGNKQYLNPSWPSSITLQIYAIISQNYLIQQLGWFKRLAMGLLPDTQICGLRMRRECRKHFPRHRLRRKMVVSDQGIHHGTCITYLAGGPWCNTTTREFNLNICVAWSRKCDSIINISNYVLPK